LPARRGFEAESSQLRIAQELILVGGDGFGDQCINGTLGDLYAHERPSLRVSSQRLVNTGKEIDGIRWCGDDAKMPVNIDKISEMESDGKHAS
jgi:hypothetical protein